MKVLILTDVPPNDKYSSGLLTLRLLENLPLNSWVCALVVNPELEHRKMADQFNDVPALYLTKPSERAPGRFEKLRLVNCALTFLKEAYHTYRTCRTLTKEVVAFAREHEVDRVWAILQGQTMIRMAWPVARKLRVPLLTQVWDLPEWWMRANSIDRLSSALVLRTYRKCLAKSTTIGAASFQMAADYQTRFAVPAFPIIASHRHHGEIGPSSIKKSDKEFFIGMAGQLYADDAWSSLLRALDACDWMLQGRKIRILYLGYTIEKPTGLRAEQIIHLGYQPQDRALAELRGCDVLYLPYWFTKSFYKECRSSFPSKLASYVVAGKPIFVHSPGYSSPATFLKQDDAAYFCESMETAAIQMRLSQIILEPGKHGPMAARATDLFNRHLSPDKQKQYLLQFLGEQTVAESSREKTFTQDLALAK